MFRTLALASFLAAALGVSACSREQAPPPPAAVEHGAAGAVAGTWEDWCGEHAVPESLCTRCSPALAAGFQATGDWCGAHGLPESQCLTCNPGLVIERPPKTAGR